MKKLLLLAFLISGFANAQTYFTRTGTTEFKASVEAFEPVEATNNSTTVLLKTATGDIAAQTFMNAFQFKVALMQEHFNENYMDSDKFPKAVFRGKIEGFSLDKLSSQDNFTIKGTLTVRGVTKDISSKATIKQKDGKIFIENSFEVTPQDFKIKIPSIVSKKIAKSIIITTNYELVKKE